MTSNWFLFLGPRGALARPRRRPHQEEKIFNRRVEFGCASATAVGCWCTHTPSLWVIATDANNTYNWLNNGTFSPIILPLTVAAATGSPFLVSHKKWSRSFAREKNNNNHTKMRLSHSNNHFIIFNERVERPPSRFSTASRSRMLMLIAHIYIIVIIKESAKNNIFEHINEFMIVFTRGRC